MRVERHLIRKEEMFWWRNILIPLTIGMCIFCVLRSPYLLSSFIERLYGPGRLNSGGRELISERTFLMLLKEGRNFLWAFALNFALARYFRRDLQSLRAGFELIFVFEILTELWKMLLVRDHVFDFAGILCMLLADVIAVLMILWHKRALI